MFQKTLDNHKTKKDSNSMLPKTSLQSKKSFRLQNGSDSVPTDSSRYVLKYDFKQKIDSMFNETRSAILEPSNSRQKKYTRTVQSECGTGPSYDRRMSDSHPNSAKKNNKKAVKNMVQVRIERMFADVSSSEIEDEGSPPNIQQFQVDYIGSLPLINRVSSLAGLQEPLRDLYFNYRRNKYPSSKMQALLEITPDGLKIQNYQKNQEPFKEQLTPFPSIAVWAAVKFVCRSQLMQHASCTLEYAFLPLVVDQTNSEHAGLFRCLEDKDISCAIEKTYDDHSPLFVVIMRQRGTSGSRLECHGFACSTSEDAIVLAANLYKVLVATMSDGNGQVNNGSLKEKKKIKCRNGLGTVCSVAGSSVCEDLDYLYPERNDQNENLKKFPPPRPPRKYKLKSDEENTEISQLQDSAHANVEPDEIIVVENTNLDDEENITNMGDKDKDEEAKDKAKSSREAASSIWSWPSMTSDKADCGDILTKVVIPRSGSFLNASGPFMSRYNRCSNTCTEGINSNNRKNSIHSPLGFIELFNELRINEGLNNIDDILNMIIDVDGMSFNSLKPIYKEFIVKLAVTLTKDELYQRSKSIMEKQKRKKKQLMNPRGKSCFSLYRFKRIFHSSISKLRPSRYKISHLSFTFPFHIFPALKKMHQKNKSQYKAKMKLNRQHAISTLTSNDSFVLGFSRQGEKDFKYHSNEIYEEKSFHFNKGEILFNKKKVFPSCHLQNMAFSATNDGMKRYTYTKDNVCFLLGNATNRNKPCNHQPISCYIPCSECSYNTESCKYGASNKCYCSMTKIKDKKKHDELEEIITQQASVSSCSCDTDSCVESEKCYCNHDQKPSIFEQLKQQGFAASESSLSRPSSPVTAWQRNEDLITNVAKDKTCLQASKSLEFFHVHRNIKTRAQSNRNLDQIALDQNNILEGSFESCVNQSNSQTGKYMAKPFIITNDNLNKSNINNANLDDSEDSDNEDFNYNNYGNQINKSFHHFQEEEESDKDDDLLDDTEATDPGEEIHYKERERNKILVVSTRDRTGQIKNSVTPLYNQNAYPSKISANFLNKDNTHEDDAISIKKTAEIAALFSDMKLEKKNHINLRTSKDIIYNSLDPAKSLFWNKPGNISIKNTNLENALGYLP